EKDAKMDELNKNHLADLREAHENYIQLQETSKAEMMILYKNMEEVIWESAAKQDESAKKTLELLEIKNEQLLIMANQAAYVEAVRAKENSELALTIKCSEELSPIKIIKPALMDNATHSCELWTQLQDEDKDANEIKKSIVGKSQEIIRNINSLLKTIDAWSSIGDLKRKWKEELMKLLKGATEYSISVRRELRKVETTDDRLFELEEECIRLNETILNLPDMQMESHESLIGRNALAAITFAENRVVTKSIATAALKTKIETIEGVTDREAIIEEP
ncbi:hypothetical protein PENTCL1PPCAC_221, partial [Pristionchus entomophagus]